MQEGDSITVDANQLLLQLNVDEAELERRRAAWTKPTPATARASLANTRDLSHVPVVVRRPTTAIDQNDDVSMRCRCRFWLLQPKHPSELG